MDVQHVAMDVRQLLYGCTTLHKWTSISFSMDVLHDILGRPPVLWTNNVWPWTSTSYYMDVPHYISGRQSVSLRTYNITSVDVHLFLYERTMCGHGCPPVTIWTYKWTSISFYMDVLHDIRERPRVSIWKYNMWPWTSTSYYKDVQHNIHGRSSVSIWTYNDWPWTSTS